MSAFGTRPFIRPRVYPIENMATADDAHGLKDIKFDDLVVDICFHPSKDVIAAGNIGGEVTLHSCSGSDSSCLMTFKHHKKACRALRFSEDGEKLYTASKDKTIKVVDLNQGSLEKTLKGHESPVYSMLVTGDNFLATGDDDGVIKVWDFRTEGAVMTLKENEEFISAMEIDSQRKILICTSGDGTLTALNIRRKKLEMQSELFDSELLSLAVIKGAQKVVCGSGEGVLNIFNWGQWGNISDRFPGHPMSVDCMCSLTDDIVCTGSCDGVVRAVNILPNRFIGVIGQHGDFPVENLTLSRDKKTLASCSHDQTIKFWNVEDIANEVVSTKKKAKKTNKPKYLSSTSRSNFFAGLGDETEQSTSGRADRLSSSEEEDSDSDDDDE